MLFPDKLSKVYLNELYNPIYIAVNSNYLFVSDNSQIKMYFLNTFKIAKILGKKGEGPGEFRGAVFPQIFSNSVMISSSFKVCFFSFEGKLLKELKTKLIRNFVRKLGDKFVCDSVKREDDFYILYNIYNKNFIKEKTFYKGKWSIHLDRSRDLFETYFYDVYKDKIYFAYRDEFKIGAVDKNGVEISLIKINPKKIPFTDKNWNDIFSNISLNPNNKAFVNSLKKSATKPKFFPDIRTCSIANNKIYVFTYLKKKSLSECLIFSTNGEFIKKVFVPFRATSDLNIHPFTIANNKIYQLVENIDKETWELFIDEI